MPHGRVHRPCPPTTSLYYLSSYPPCAYLYVHAFAVFLRVSKMLYGAASGDQFGTPWARILLGFRCFASMPHGCVHRLCPPIRADMSSYPPCAYLSMLWSMLLAVFFSGFAAAVRHRLWGSIWHALGSNSAGVPLFRQHASRMRSSAMSAYMRLYVQLYPPWCAYRMLLSMLLLCFLQVSKMLYGTASGDQFGTPWARILLGFRCFASMLHGCVHRPRPPAMRLCPPSCPPRAYYTHAFALFLRVSKMLYGTASGDQFGTPWARILLGFRCFASMPHGRVHRPCPPTTSLYDLSSYPPCAYLYVHAFAVFLRVSTMLYGTASGDQFGTPWARILLGFRCFASMPHGCVPRLCPPIRADMSSYPPCAYLSMLLSMLLAVFFTGFEDAVRHRLWGSIWHALGSNSAGVPLFRKHASRMRSSAMSAYTRLYVHLYPP